MNEFPDLNAFLQTLRGEGLTVGPRELIWLHHLFKQAPVLERERLQEMLGCVLAKTPAQRRRFDGLFDLWLDKVSDSPTGRALLTPGKITSKTSEKLPAEENAPPGPKPPPRPQTPQTQGSLEKGHHVRV
jgi:uncharacterized protein with von Willebrand factor type A (vWA) domain